MIKTTLHEITLDIFDDQGSEQTRLINVLYLYITRINLNIYIYKNGNYKASSQNKVIIIDEKHFV